MPTREAMMRAAGVLALASVVAPWATPAGAAPAPVPAGADALQPHVAVYATRFRGLSAGEIELTLRRDGAPDRFVYETRANPSALARMLVNSRTIERSWFALTPRGVRPAKYLLEDGTRERKHDVELVYDWAAARVRGTARMAPVDLPLEPGTQDVLSIRAALPADLAAGREPGEYVVLDSGEPKRYVWTREREEPLETALGRLDTVVYTSRRKGGDARSRVWTYWYAPALGWLTVRAVQSVEGQPRAELAIRAWRALEPAR